MLAELCAEADLASTTSSLRVADLAARSGAAERVFGLHVFNPVARMELVELCLPEGLRDGAAERARLWCGASSARPRSRFPTSPASWSTGCCSRSCSRRCG